MILNPDRNAAIISAWRKDWSYSEIAERIGVSRNVVAGVIHRAGLTDSASPKAVRFVLSDSEISRAARIAAEIGTMAAAKRFGISPSAVTVRARKLGVQLTSKSLKVTDEQVAEIRRLRAAGFSLKEVARRFGIAPNYVCVLDRQSPRGRAA
jgi:hypothetical protein